MPNSPAHTRRRAAIIRISSGPTGCVPRFFNAWARLTVIQTGSIALLAFVVGDYLAQLFDLGSWSAPVYAALAVIGLTGINWLGVRQGTTAQNWLTAFELAGLLLVIVAGSCLRRTNR